MYYKEEIINGIWHWKSSTDGEWQQFTAFMIKKKIQDHKKQIGELRIQLEIVRNQS